MMSIERCPGPRHGIKTIAIVTFGNGEWCVVSCGWQLVSAVTCHKLSSTIDAKAWAKVVAQPSCLIIERPAELLCIRTNLAVCTVISWGLAVVRDRVSAAQFKCVLPLESHRHCMIQVAEARDFAELKQKCHQKWLASWNRIIGKFLNDVVRILKPI